jgi:hypothetical protein
MLISSLTQSPPTDVVNGEKNRISLTVENKSDRNVTLTSVAGSFHNPDTNDVIKNVRNLKSFRRVTASEKWWLQVSALQYDIRLIEGTKLQIPYTFHSE